MSKNIKITIIVAVAIIIIGIIIFLFYKKKKASENGNASGNSGRPNDTGSTTGTTTADRKVGDAALCGWLNATYPKLKTSEFADIDGGRDNPQSQVDWKKNNCDLMSFATASRSR